MSPHVITPIRTLTTALALVATITAAGLAQAAPDHPQIERCPTLSVLGVQGGDEGMLGIEKDSDTGTLGVVFGRVSAAVGDAVERAYVPFDGARLPYESAVQEATERLEQTAVEIVARCPNTRLAVAGYAHGAAVASRFAERVGAGIGGVPEERVGAVALLANPERRVGTPVIPGRPEATGPSRVPGTTGGQVEAVTLLNPARAGAGITATSSGSPRTYGTLTGRVADLCAAGDATCDTPPGSPLATTVANITADADLRDPIAAISTIADALSTTVFTTAVEVVNHDITGTSLDQLSYQPRESLGQRLADASGPDATPPTSDDALAALFRIGTIGLNAVVTVARSVITPATVAELATVGMVDPLAAVAMLGAKLAAAAIELVPPHTASRWVNDAFDAITSTITEPDQLYTLAGTAQYSTTTGRHGAYRSTPATPRGESSLTAAANWFTAATRDLTTATTSPTRPPASRTATSTSQPSTAARPSP